VFAGVDAGGSRCEAVIVDANGRVLARARGGPAALRPDNAKEVAGRIAVTVGRALAEVGPTDLKSIVVAAAGAGRNAERQALAAALAENHLAQRVEIIGDGAAALESAFGKGPGMILISGTGSIAYAREASGAVYRTGGLGWQLGDEGSGYAIGRAALGAAGRAADQRGERTALLDRIYAATGTNTLDQLVQWAQTASRADVSGLAPLAGDAALEGDAVARALIDSAANDLCALVIALLKLVPNTADVALAGGLLSGDSPLRRAVVSGLSRVAPQLRVVTTQVDGALGAALLASQL